MNTIHPDAELIKTLGGPTKIAELLGIAKKGGAQRVQNWTQRGIPSHVKVQRPDLFMSGLAQAPANQVQPATETVAQGV
jgi:hypothetical protein